MPPKFKVGNILESKDEVIIVTGNGTLDRRGHLVMGAGSAKALAEMYPGIPEFFGTNLMYHSVFDLKNTDRNIGDLKLYGLLLRESGFKTEKHQMVGVLQTKIHWKDSSSLSLIGYSLTHLHNYMQTNPPAVSLVFPGIGLGGLKRSEVLPMLMEFDKHLTIYELPKTRKGK